MFLLKLCSSKCTLFQSHSFLYFFHHDGSIDGNGVYVLYDRTRNEEQRIDGKMNDNVAIVK